MNPYIKQYLDDRGLEPAQVEIRERLHIEKIDMEGPEPVVVETLVVENGKIVNRTTKE